MITQSPSNLLIPLTHEQLSSLQEITVGFNRTQLIWLSGYFWGLAYQTKDIVPELATTSAEPSLITLISASQTGNARLLAEQLYNDLLEAKLKVNLFNAYDYKFKQINQEKLLIIVTSTQGEGEPPEEAVAMYKFLMSKKAPNCKNTCFAVFGLGDSSYQFFNQAAKDLDTRLADLGAERLLERVDADVDYTETANSWRQQLIKILKERILSNSYVQPALSIPDNINKIYDNNQYTKEAPLTTNILVNQKITGRYSDKDVRHIEINLDNSLLCYQPGDALGVWYENDLKLVQEILHLLNLKGDELIKINDKNLSLYEALQKHFELTVNTTNIVRQYAAFSCDKKLLTIVNDNAKLYHYAKCLPLVDMIRDIPVYLSAQQLTNLLKPLTPRLYSIASSQTENKTEVHITVGVVRYEINGHIRGGGASTWLADRIEENSEIRIFVEHNNNFRLPQNTDASIIMIGAGTGIAPFRAFMQQRHNNGAKGKNWLFFGNPHFTEDFLYQVEWQKYFRDGLLTNIDLAWSRDQAKKIYVQDKISIKSKELWSWIKDGAYIYVCGDANHMAKDVEQALLDVVIEHGGMSSENADEFLSDLRIKRRYQRDIY